jgi:hypothetical protein
MKRMGLLGMIARCVPCLENSRSSAFNLCLYLTDKHGNEYLDYFFPFLT